MEGQSSSHNNPMQVMPFNVGNDVSHVGEDVQSQRILMASGRNWGHNDISVNVPWWINQPQEASHNYVKFLAESSAFLQMNNNNNPSEDMMMLESLSLPVSGTYAVSGVSDFQIDMSYNHLGQACDSTRSTEIDAWQSRLLMPHNENTDIKFTSAQHQIHAQDHAYWTQISNGDSYNNVSRADIPRTARVASPKSLSQPHSCASKPKTNTTDRQRRMRISDRLSSLQELLPSSVEGCQLSILDDVIDHVKSLQLQIKDICRSRLEGESETEAIIFREGFGHYLGEQQMSNEPLEEMIGKLLELNPLDAIQLLEMKGLLLMPIEFTKGLV
ncbi:hypothetical protein L484_025045 [Morus notabilis]|uniref:BHLH domain-containing protein n=1 Tax=Morus notabilis TaxID=981085 RepID=W9QKQ9_9ROSA|nr:transcription factor bHLH66 isoform X2 [Morus notabilis]EXB39350.1 hypothetical protein L484_025045 [Morus notabilis]